jgi:hypothetical protein
VAEHPLWQWRPEYEQVWGGPDECLETIADVHADDGETMESRGRMIAAVPRLLDALRTVLPLLGGWREVIAELDDMPKSCSLSKAMWASLDQIDEARKELGAAIRLATEGTAEST